MAHAERTDLLPTVVTPSAVAGAEAELLTFTVTASDPDGEPIESLTASPLPFGAGFAKSSNNADGVFTWTPTYLQAGIYSVTISAESACRANGVSAPVCAIGSALTEITVANVDRSPFVLCPSEEVAAEGGEVVITVTAGDPDGDAIVSLSADPLPAGATFSLGAGNTVGFFTWTPNFDQAGNYTVTFSAANDMLATAVVHITVMNTDRLPIFDLPARVDGFEGVPVVFHVGAYDPDGDPMMSVAGWLLPPRATFVADQNGTGGTFSWTPQFNEAGNRTATFLAQSCTSDTNCPFSSATVDLSIRDVDQPPRITVVDRNDPDDPTTFDYDITVFDPDGDHISVLTVSPLPTGATFQAASGHLHWTPSAGQEGTYVLTVGVGSCHSGFLNPLTCGPTSKSFQVVVTAVNRRPIADPGGPYRGVPNVPITFTGAHSYDPDGSTLTYTWDFGDGSGSGATPQHAYQYMGVYPVSLTVGDGIAVTTEFTDASIDAYIGARGFVKGGSTALILSRSNPWCLQVEPNAGSAADLSSLRLRYGSSEANAVESKSSTVNDTDANGIAEVCSCFQMDDLRHLFENLSVGTHYVGVNLEGYVARIGPLSGAVYIAVTVSAGLSASVAPNPPNPDARLTFVTKIPGSVRISLFDSRGRLVRNVLDSFQPAGYHEIRIGPEHGGTGRLPSGIYFYRIQAAEGTDTGRLVVTH